MKEGLKIITVGVKACIAILLFSSCQKEITGGIVPVSSSSPSGKLKTYTESLVSNSGSGNVADSFDLSYDSNGRLVSLISGLNTGNKFIYTYNANNTAVMDIFEANALSIHILFFINNSSLADSSFQINDTNDTTTEKYIYNANKQLITQKIYFFQSGIADITITNYTYDNSGSLIKVQDNTSTTTYEYYPNAMYDVNIGPAYLPQNTRLIKTTTYTSNGSTDTANFTYTFDSSNRISSEKDVTSTGASVIKTYTYY